MELAIDVEAEDVSSDNTSPEDGGRNEAESVGDDACYQFKCDPRGLKRVSDAIKSRSFSIMSASLEYIPKTYVALPLRKYERALQMVKLLAEQDEVMDVYDNFILETSD